ncbi:MAG: matrixin family metalloprotease, partial [Planctomycetota bacterium]|nr:matrixin family metalloprotease [Planctomycetota bacterium]
YNIPTATVTFVITNEDGPGSWTISDVPVQPLGTDPLTGVAVYTWVVDDFFTNTDVATTLKVEMIVDSYYTGGDDTTLVTVAKPDGDFITGGGYLIESDSYGGTATLTDAEGAVREVQLDVADGSKMNFGFVVKYNKKFTNLQGKFTSILRMEDGTKWQLKSTATRHLGIAEHTNIEDAYMATFESKAVLKNLTEGGSQGGLTMILNVTDFGEPGSQDPEPTPDTINYTLWDGPTLIFSTHWDGSVALEQNLIGGNIQIHTNDSGGGASGGGGGKGNKLELEASGMDPVALSTSLTPDTLTALADAAMDVWQSAGLTEAETSQLGAVRVHMRDLPDGTLGLAADRNVWIDPNAAGLGWFTGVTGPYADAGFAGVDLLSVVVHEFGHVLGFEHAGDHNDVMYASLDVGVRRLPTASLPSDYIAPRLIDGDRAVIGNWTVTDRREDALDSILAKWTRGSLYDDVVDGLVPPARLLQPSVRAFDKDVEDERIPSTADRDLFFAGIDGLDGDEDELSGSLDDVTMNLDELPVAAL